jgi:hypothetical protein
MGNFLYSFHTLCVSIFFMSLLIIVLNWIGRARRVECSSGAELGS